MEHDNIVDPNSNSLSFQENKKLNMVSKLCLVGGLKFQSSRNLFMWSQKEKEKLQLKIFIRIFRDHAILKRFLSSYEFFLWLRDNWFFSDEFLWNYLGIREKKIQLREKREGVTLARNLSCYVLKFTWNLDTCNLRYLLEGV